jgi:hypothetical protein
MITYYIHKMSEENIFKVIIDTMIQCQHDVTIEDKKIYAMQIISNLIPRDTYNRYEPFISLSIDFTKAIFKDRGILNGLKSKKCIKFKCY